ncbi:Olfactory receptor 1F12 [Plecturocebus cupreus]
MPDIGDGEEGSKSHCHIKLYLIKIPTESTFYILSWLWLQMNAKIKYFKKDTLQPGVVAHACNSSNLGGQGRWIMKSRDQDHLGQHDYSNVKPAKDTH